MFVDIVIFISGFFNICRFFYIVKFFYPHFCYFSEQFSTVKMTKIRFPEIRFFFCISDMILVSAFRKGGSSLWADIMKKVYITS